MNRRSTLSIAACVGAVVLVGCANSIRIKAVDAVTGQPLSGVTAEWRQNRHQISQLIAHTGPIKLPPSDRDGLIEVRPIYRTWSSQFVFLVPGCSNTYGQYSWRRNLVVATNVDYRSGQFEGEFILRGQLETAVKSNWNFIVRIHK